MEVRNEEMDIVVAVERTAQAANARTGIENYEFAARSAHFYARRIATETGIAALGRGRGTAHSPEANLEPVLHISPIGRFALRY